jgi:hypothetical protein
LTSIFKGKFGRSRFEGMTLVRFFEAACRNFCDIRK